MLAQRLEEIVDIRRVDPGDRGYRHIGISEDHVVMDLREAWRRRVFVSVERREATSGRAVVVTFRRFLLFFPNRLHGGQAFHVALVTAEG